MNWKLANVSSFNDLKDGDLFLNEEKLYMKVEDVVLSTLNNEKDVNAVDCTVGTHVHFEDHAIVQKVKRVEVHLA